MINLRPSGSTQTLVEHLTGWVSQRHESRTFDVYTVYLDLSSRWNECHKVWCIQNCHETESYSKDNQMWVQFYRFGLNQCIAIQCNIACLLLSTVGAVDLDILFHAFSEFGWEGSSHNCNTLSVLELESLLNKVFQLAQRTRSRFLQPDKCVEITLNWSLGCLDRSVAITESTALIVLLWVLFIYHNITYSGRTGVVKLRSVKIALAALCSSVPEDKYRCKLDKKVWDLEGEYETCSFFFQTFSLKFVVSEVWAYQSQVSRHYFKTYSWLVHLPT